MKRASTFAERDAEEVAARQREALHEQLLSIKNSCHSGLRILGEKSATNAKNQAALSAVQTAAESLTDEITSQGIALSGAVSRVPVLPRGVQLKHVFASECDASIAALARHAAELETTRLAVVARLAEVEEQLKAFD